MALFETAYNHTGRREGGKWTCDPNDPGGETYCGISRVNWPTWPGWAIIDGYKPAHGGHVSLLVATQTKDVNHLNLFNEALKRDQALGPLVVSFFEMNFWNRLLLGAVTNQEIANEIYDTAVNLSPEKATEFVQRGLNLLNKEALLWEDLSVDRMMGNKTLAVLNRCLQFTDCAEALLKTLNHFQGYQYASLCERNPHLERYYKGWVLQRT